MTVTGKHRELLIELLIYYLNKDNHDVKFTNFINEENSTGRYWIDAYIDDYKDLEYYIIINSRNKTLGIKR
jgi:intein-encoded DNA endonuclease-like protein